MDDPVDDILLFKKELVIYFCQFIKFNALIGLQVLAIEKWDTDTVEEFLKTHLIPPEELNDKNDYLKTNMI